MVTKNKRRWFLGYPRGYISYVYLDPWDFMGKYSVNDGSLILIDTHGY